MPTTSSEYVFGHRKVSLSLSFNSKGEFEGVAFEGFSPDEAAFFSSLSLLKGARDSQLLSWPQAPGEFFSLPREVFLQTLWKHLAGPLPPPCPSPLVCRCFGVRVSDLKNTPHSQWEGVLRAGLGCGSCGHDLRALKRALHPTPWKLFLMIQKLAHPLELHKVEGRRLYFLQAVPNPGPLQSLLQKELGIWFEIAPPVL